MPLSPGDRLGPYEILSPLIRVGGMGEVYKARDTRLSRIVALKLSKAESPTVSNRKATLVAQLNHKNICILYDVGPNFLVMEFVNGVPLKGPVCGGESRRIRRADFSTPSTPRTASPSPTAI